MKKRVVIVIPCRSGSKRIPDKNFQKVGGKSLIYRAANVAVNIAPTVGRYEIEKKVIVASDSGNHERVLSELQSLSRLLTVRQRTTESEDGPSWQVVLDAIGDMKYDVACLVQATSPFLLPSDIQGCMTPILANGLGSCRTAILKKHTIRGSKNGRNHERLIETGGCYSAVGCAALQRMDGWVPYYVDPMRAIEIDEPHELELANIIAEAKGW